MIQDFKNLLFPRLCACCDENLMKFEDVICTFCRNELPLCQNYFDGDHELHKILYGRVRLHQAASLFYFEKKNNVQQLIHDLKYRKNRAISAFLGQWIGEILFQAGWQNQIDIVIPVPLHKRRLRTRGFNQVEGFGKAIAAKLSAKYEDKVLLRKSTTKTQVFKSRFARTDVVQGNFYSKNIESLNHKHILLVDDLATTGSTLEACWMALNSAKNIKLNIATMAISK
ncbi:ComF family protein [Psychroflexus aestuariivivens]|uniref:ComF family protein n=1 Tax=Psychroflexus aestuariivivens TaxID=1795040 RepID=UPI000FDB7D36|nr:phosphoribosyltransferase family protein [Psychroflexus aestuariivivens]